MTHHLLYIPFSRRRFLQGLGGFAALSLLNIPLSVLVQASVAGGRKLLTGWGSGVGENLMIADLLSGDMRTVPLNLKPHSFVPHPVKPEIVWVIERGYDEAEGAPDYPASTLGPEAAAGVNIETGEVLQSIAPPEGSRFFGHGFFMPDGATLFISRVDMNTGGGFLTGYDPKGKMIADYPVAKGAMHEIRLLPDGTAMAANSGIRPLPGPEGRLAGPRLDTGAILHIDLASGKVLQKQIVEDDAQMIGHFHRMEDDTLITLARPRAASKGQPGKVFTGKFGEDALRQVPFTDRVKPGREGECLSLAVDERSKRALITNPENKRILAMDTHEGVFVGDVPVFSTGVVFDESTHRFIAGNAQLVAIDPATLKISDLKPPETNPSKEGSFNSAHTFLL